MLTLAGLFVIVHESALQQQLAPLPFLQQECAFLPFLVFFLQQFIAPGSQQPSLLQQAAVEFEFCGVPKLIAAAEIAKLPPQTIAITRAFILLIDLLLCRYRGALRQNCGQVYLDHGRLSSKFSRAKSPRFPLIYGRQAELAGSPILRVAQTRGSFQPATGEFSMFKWLVK